MQSNRFGRYFGITTFGESHGESMGLVIEDIKPNIDFPFDELKIALEKRKPGRSNTMSSRKEIDDYRVISGVLDGKTTGMPICILFENRDARSEDYDYLKDCFRPGHADYSWFHKFKIYDWRGGGRASGRETICRVAGASLIEHILGKIMIECQTIQIGKLKAQVFDQTFSEQNSLHWSDPENYEDILRYLSEMKEEKDSIGSIVEVRIKNLNKGLGDPVFEKLDANLAKAIMSIGGVKGIEFGDGFHLSEAKGSEVNDQINSKGFMSNHAGGINGGVSTGQDIIIRIAIKPVSTIGKPQKTVTHDNIDRLINNIGRHDVCLVPRIIPVIEAMIKLVLADAISYQNIIENKEDDLTSLREAIDKIDEDLLISIRKRMELSKKVGLFKKNKGIEVKDPEREAKILKQLEEKSNIMNIDEKLVSEIWNVIFEFSRKKQ